MLDTIPPEEQTPEFARSTALFAQARARAILGLAPHSVVACIHLAAAVASDDIRIDRVRRACALAVRRRVGLRTTGMSESATTLIGAIVKRVGEVERG